MIRDVTSILATCKLIDLLGILSRHKITGLPGVNNDQEVVGFISLHEIIRATLPNYLEIINSNSILSEFIQLSKSLKEYSQRPVEEFMRKNIIQRLPVLRNGKLVGIVTLTDICRVLMYENK